MSRRELIILMIKFEFVVRIRDRNLILVRKIFRGRFNCKMGELVVYLLQSDKIMLMCGVDIV